MQATSRLTPADRLISALATGAIATSVVLGNLLRGQHPSSLPTLCWSQLLFHRECPGCGLTRSFLALGRGSLAEAERLNPLGPILFLFAIALLLVRLGRMVAPRFRYWTEVDIGFGAALVLCLVVRTVSFYAG